MHDPATHIPTMHCAALDTASVSHWHALRAALMRLGVIELRHLLRQHTRQMPRMHAASLVQTRRPHAANPALGLRAALCQVALATGQGSVNVRFCDGACSETSQNVTVFMFLRSLQDDKTLFC